MIDPELEMIKKRKLDSMRKRILEENEGSGMGKVTVYSTKTCPYCSLAKEYLKSKNVPYEDVDVGSDRAKAQEMMKKSGQMGVPVIEINGKIIVGFDRGAIDEALSG